MADEALEKYEQKYEELPARMRLYIFTLDSFRERATWKGLQHWERYTWARLKVENDRSGGEIQNLLDEKGRVPPEHAQDHVRYSLRWYFNQSYHSLKNLRAGNMVGYRLEAAEGIRPFLEAIFCIHERRLVPYYKYLKWELETFPLVKLSLTADELLRCIMRIQEDGDYRTQQRLFREAKRVFSVEGFGYFFDEYWGRVVLNYPDVVNF